MTDPPHLLVTKSCAAKQPTCLLREPLQTWFHAARAGCSDFRVLDLPVNSIGVMAIDLDVSHRPGQRWHVYKRRLVEAGARCSDHSTMFQAFAARMLPRLSCTQPQTSKAEPQLNHDMWSHQVPWSCHSSQNPRNRAHRFQHSCDVSRPRFSGWGALNLIWVSRISPFRPRFPPSVRCKPHPHSFVMKLMTSRHLSKSTRRFLLKMFLKSIQGHLQPGPP